MQEKLENEISQDKNYIKEIILDFLPLLIHTTAITVRKKY